MLVSSKVLNKKFYNVEFEEKVLKPRGLNYKIQFPGPTGTKKRPSVISSTVYHRTPP